SSRQSDVRPDDRRSQQSDQPIVDRSVGKSEGVPAPGRFQPHPYVVSGFSRTSWWLGIGTALEICDTHTRPSTRGTSSKAQEMFDAAYFRDRLPLDLRDQSQAARGLEPVVKVHL